MERLSVMKVGPDLPVIIKSALKNAKENAKMEYATASLDLMEKIATSKLARMSVILTVSALMELAPVKEDGLAIPVKLEKL